MIGTKKNSARFGNKLKRPWFPLERTQFSAWSDSLPPPNAKATAPRCWEGLKRFLESPRKRNHRKQGVGAKT